MKSLNLKVSLLLTLIVSVVLFFACSKTTKEVQCSISKPTEILNLKIGANAGEYSVWVGATRNSNDFSYSFSRANTTSTNAQILNTLQSFGINQNVNPVLKNVVASVFFIDKKLTNNISIQIENIKGLLLYSVGEKDKLVTTVLKNNGTTFEEINSLQSHTDAISSNDIFSIASIFKREVTQFLSSIQIATFEKLYKRDVDENFRMNIYKYFKSPILGSTLPQQNGLYNPHLTMQKMQLVKSPVIV